MSDCPIDQSEWGVWMSILSMIFSEVSSPFTWLVNKVENMRMNLERLGAPGLMPRLGDDAPGTLRGRQRREKAEAENRQRTMVTHLMMVDDAMERLEASKSAADERFDYLNDRIERRLDRIDQLLNDSDLALSEERRQALEAERLALIQHQQEMIEAQQRLDDRYDAIHTLPPEERDPDEIDALVRDYLKTLERVESEYEAIPSSIAPPVEVENEYVQNTGMAVSAPILQG